MSEQTKPIHAKPSLYAFYFEALKGVALEYGYNLVLHGSLNRDLDLIAIPWQEKVGDLIEMLNKFSEAIGGFWTDMNDEYPKPHGRKTYVIHVNRAGAWNNYQDAQYYIDISVTPTK